MRESDNIGVTFVNSVVNRGVFNDIVNINLAAYNFTPSDDGMIELDPAIVARLRMDIACATQLRDTLDDILKYIEKTKAGAMNGNKMEETSKPKKRVEVN